MRRVRLEKVWRVVEAKDDYHPGEHVIGWFWVNFHPGVEDEDGNIWLEAASVDAVYGDYMRDFLGTSLIMHPRNGGLS